MFNVQREFQGLNNTQLQNIIQTNKVTNNSWTVDMQGPMNTSLQGHNYQLGFEFKNIYPENPPVVTVLSSTCPFLKPNEIDMPFLREDWTPFFKISNILNNIESFLLQTFSMSQSMIADNTQVMIDIAKYQNSMQQYANMSAQQQNNNLGPKMMAPVPMAKNIDLMQPAGVPGNSKLEFLKASIEDLDSQCSNLQKLLGETNLAVIKNSFIQQIEDLIDLKNSLWTDYYSNYKQGIKQAVYKLNR